MNAHLHVVGIRHPAAIKRKRGNAYKAHVGTSGFCLCERIPPNSLGGDYVLELTSPVSTRSEHSVLVPTSIRLGCGFVPPIKWAPAFRTSPHREILFARRPQRTSLSPFSIVLCKSSPHNCPVVLNPPNQLCAVAAPPCCEVTGGHCEQGRAGAQHMLAELASRYPRAWGRRPRAFAGSNAQEKPTSRITQILG